MELVDGVPITQAADARGLNLVQRLAWFSKLCRTIEAAHTALIVHRDLKPSNLFVTAEGDLKVLDFGIAKLVDNDEHTTRTQSIALTPEYAAPEQYGPAPVTTAVDVYALGVVLGELLTGMRLTGGIRASRAVAATEDTDSLPRGLPPPERWPGSCPAISMRSLLARSPTSRRCATRALVRLPTMSSAFLPAGRCACIRRHVCTARTSSYAAIVAPWRRP